MSITAKFRVHRINELEDSRDVHLTAVTSSDPSNENYSWSKLTPGGVIQMNITNPDAFNQFVVGHEYLLTFTDVTASQDQVAASTSTAATTDAAVGQAVADTATSTTDTASGASADTSTSTAGEAVQTAADAAPVSTGTADSQAQTTEGTSVAS